MNKNNSNKHSADEEKHTVIYSEGESYVTPIMNEIFAELNATNNQDNNLSSQSSMTKNNDKEKSDDSNKEAFVTLDVLPETHRLIAANSSEINQANENNCNLENEYVMVSSHPSTDRLFESTNLSDVVENTISSENEEYKFGGEGEGDETYVAVDSFNLIESLESISDSDESPRFFFCGNSNHVDQPLSFIDIQFDAKPDGYLF